MVYIHINIVGMVIGVHYIQIFQIKDIIDSYKNSPMIATWKWRNIYIPYITYFSYQYIQAEGYPLHICEIIADKNMLISYFIYTHFDYIGSIRIGPTSSTNYVSNANILNQCVGTNEYKYF